ncbi:MAG: aldo/keto reductase [Solirubrobacterales bacterium]|jgi:2,5-diketo-D-gluconate reductase A
MTDIPDLELNSGHSIPQLGFGTWQIEPEDAGDAVGEALSLGYRLVDTAAAYGNEREVGGALNGSGIGREELFVTTKVWNSNHGREDTQRACHKSLSKLGLDYLDLYLIHWPVPAQDRYVETWQAMEELRDEGLIRSIGVCNFNEDHLDRLADETDTVPAVNQIEVHPYLQQVGLRRANAERGIVTEDWSPLAEGRPFEEESIKRIAEEHARTPAQIVLRWHLQLGSVVIPKSVTPERIAENLELFDFELTGEEMDLIAELDAGERTGPNPAEFSVA